MALSDEEKDQLTQLETDDLSKSNDDCILAVPGSLVAKTWRIRNKSSNILPRDTRIVSVTQGLCFEGPQ